MYYYLSINSLLSNYNVLYLDGITSFNFVLLVKPGLKVGNQNVSVKNKIDLNYRKYSDESCILDLYLNFNCKITRGK